MPPNLPDPKEIGFYYSLGQVGLEMVVPVVVGVLLDRYLDWTPWGVVVGAVLGLVTGLTHLVYLTNQREQARTKQPRQDNP